MVNEPITIIKTLSDYLSTLDNEALNEFIFECLQNAQMSGFILKIASVIGVGFIFLSAIFWFLISLADAVAQLIGTRNSRKNFKKRYVQDNPYEIIPVLGGGTVEENYIVSGWTPKNKDCNEIWCFREENARLICTIMNCDAVHKKFNIKAYLKGLDIEKLKSLNEGQEV